jgi:hypothetical protein
VRFKGRLLQYDLKKGSKVSSITCFFPFSFEQIILQLSKFISGKRMNQISRLMATEMEFRNEAVRC